MQTLKGLDTCGIPSSRAISNNREIGINIEDLNITSMYDIPKEVIDSLYRTGYTQQKIGEIFGYSGRPNPDHIWVRPPPSPEAEYLLLVSLRHLGIRPAWLQSWSKLRDGLENLCAIPTV